MYAQLPYGRTAFFTTALFQIACRIMVWDFHSQLPCHPSEVLGHAASGPVPFITTVCCLGGPADHNVNEGGGFSFYLELPQISSITNPRQGSQGGCVKPLVTLLPQSGSRERWILALCLCVVWNLRDRDWNHPWWADLPTSVNRKWSTVDMSVIIDCFKLAVKADSQMWCNHSSL